MSGLFSLPGDTKKMGVRRNKVTGSSKVTAIGEQPAMFSFGTPDATAGIENLIPKDPKKLTELYRKIYLYDSVCGATIDLMSQLPYSEFSLSGVEDTAVLNVFQESLDHLNVLTLIPQMSVEFLTIGYLVGTLVFNAEHGIFTDLIVQDPEFCEIEYIPLHGYDPKVDLKIPPEFRKFLTSQDERDKNARSELSDELITKLLSGKIALDQDSTLYLNRKTYPKDTGTSYLSRIIPYFILEHILLEGTIQGAQRRQRAITHIVAGSDDWEPSETQLEELIEMFVSADQDPIGAVVATKQDVEVNEIKSGGDFWKITDEWDTLTNAKMRALGINEAFLTGDATYNTMEAALSVFIETLKAFRDYMTQKIFYFKIFPLLSQVHRFIKRSNAELDHRIRISGGVPAYGSQSIPYKDLIIPELQWHKQLQPSYDESYMSILDTVQEKGIPIPLRVWAAAGGFSLDKLIDTLSEDVEQRKRISDYKKAVKDATGGGGDDDEEESGWGVGLDRKPRKRSKQKVHKITGRAKKAKKEKVENPALTDALVRYAERCNVNRKENDVSFIGEHNTKSLSTIH